MDEFDIQAIVIDCGPMGRDRPGILTVRQMMHMTGKMPACAVGLTEKLHSEKDDGGGQSESAQAGVRLILETLSVSDGPVTVFTTGSLRDLAAAFNREPQLLMEKIKRIYINAGHSSGGKEYNVGIDVCSYVCVLNSGLPVYLVPCFGNGGYQSLWTFRQGDILESASARVRNFFRYALLKVDPQAVDPIRGLDTHLRDTTEMGIGEMERRMWCTAAFLHAAGRDSRAFSFRKVNVKVEEDGKTLIVPKGQGKSMYVFHVEKPDVYEAAMTEALRDIVVSIDGRSAPRTQGT